MLHLSLHISLENFDVHAFVRPHGPLFNRWLPNGRGDAISVPVADSRNELKFWFVRRGFTDGSFIRYEAKRNEIDEDTMRRQAVLDAGPLLGEARFVHVMPDELAAIRVAAVGSDAYMAVGRRIIDFVYAPTSAFLDLLRLQYGQHWLPELHPWDSRQESLGSYCSTLGLHWRESEDQAWSAFRPTELSATIYVGPNPGRGYAEYLTESDWRHLQSNFNPSASLPLAVRLLGRAHQLSDTGHTSEGLVQAVTALELALDHFLTEQCRSYSPQVRDNTKPITDLPLKAQLSMVAAATSLIPTATLDDALRGIDLRNRIVHEAAMVTESSKDMLRAVLQCAQALLRLPEFKMPILSSGNELSAPSAA
jgi:hypothetical protein